MWFFLVWYLLGVFAVDDAIFFFVFWVAFLKQSLNRLQVAYEFVWISMDSASFG
jgi:hypothetical protein